MNLTDLINRLNQIYDDCSTSQEYHPVTIATSAGHEDVIDVVYCQEHEAYHIVTEKM